MVSEVLGHASIAITKDIYGHLMEGERRPRQFPALCWDNESGVAPRVAPRVAPDDAEETG
ncbi:hypothetical protein GCM10010116_11470 [Microbispora rosea subsp. aerata]|nr:hypothetical protein GCM10010116_11470 [Microbispora rosea subsp. aerata]